MKRFTALQLLLGCALSAAITLGLLLGVRAMGWHRAWLQTAHRREPSAGAHDADLAREAQQAYQAIVARRDLALPPEQQTQIAKAIYALEIWTRTWWLGIPVAKNPCDLWMMQQIMQEIRPDYIIEAGTCRGGSALYFAHILDGMGLTHSKVITIDIEDQCQEAARHRLWREKVEFILGSSTDPSVVARVRQRVQGKTVMVSLDSDHHCSHVLEELKCYSDLVSPGSYLVVEDTNVDGVPVLPEFGPGPMAAVRKFLQTEQGQAFTQDFSREAMVLTFNPGGWLKKR